MLEKIRYLWEHAVWADLELLAAQRAENGEHQSALREFSHVIAAEELWLARLEERPPRCAVWPELDLESLGELVRRTHGSFSAYLASLSEADLETDVTYTNSAGKTFTNNVADILLHVFLHGQYHRGKINLLLREAGSTPAPVDFIGFVRGVPAATSVPPDENASR